MRRFHLLRLHDPSGVSGIGVVAHGVVFENGVVVLAWRGSHPSVAVWPSLSDAMAVHGHDGATTIVWLDEEGA